VKVVVVDVLVDVAIVENDVDVVDEVVDEVVVTVGLYVVEVVRDGVVMDAIPTPPTGCEYGVARAIRLAAKIASIIKTDLMALNS
jgi:hypothetical protein